MRESHKSDLKSILIENVHNFETYPTSRIVVGGALLHQVSWNKNCSCRKNGLPCVIACRNAHGENCTNVSKVEIMDDSEDESFERNAFELFNI